MTKQIKVFRNVCAFIKIKKTEILHNYSDTLLSTLLKHLWQWLQPWVFLLCPCKLGTHVQYMGSFSPFFSEDPLKLCQVGWGASLHSYFQVSPEMFDRVQVGLWLSHSRTFRDLSRRHSCIVLAVCLGLFSCWNVNLHTSLRSWELWSRFSLRFSLYSFHLPPDPD